MIRRPKPRYTIRMLGWTILIYRWRIDLDPR